MKNLHTCFLSLALILFAGCGQPTDHAEGHDHSAHGRQSSGAQDPGTVVTVDGVTIVEMTGNDQMKFNLEAFTVKSGDTVRLIFHNIGRLPKQAMGHNVVFLVEGADPNAFVTAASRARDNDYIPEELSDQILAYTEMLGPNQSDTIEFIAPEPGEYLYLCSFPGHLFGGMRGIMTVEPAE